MSRDKLTAQEFVIQLIGERIALRNLMQDIDSQLQSLADRIEKCEHFNDQFKDIRCDYSDWCYLTDIASDPHERLAQLSKSHDIEILSQNNPEDLLILYNDLKTNYDIIWQQNVDYRKRYNEEHIKKDLGGK